MNINEGITGARIPIVAEAARADPTLSRPGGVEHDLMEILEAQVETVRCSLKERKRRSIADDHRH